MKINSSKHLFIAIFVLTFFVGCGSAVKITGSFSDKKLFDRLKNNNNLVLVKVADKNARYLLENEFTAKLADKGIKSEAAIIKFPPLEPNKLRTEEQIKQTLEIFKTENINTVILTTLKEIDQTVHTETSGGYFVAGSYYPYYYREFYGYYYNYYDPGVYIPLNSTTSVLKKYHLETVVYDLNNDKNKQLLSVTTVEVEDPKKVDKIALKYAELVVDEMLKDIP